MSSFRKQLEDNGKRKIALRQETKRKYSSKREHLIERIKLSLSNIDSMTLLSISETGEYVVYKVVDRSIILKSTEIPILSCDEDKFEFNFSTHYKDVERGINADKMTINVYWLFKFIKENVKSIGDVEPIINENTYEISYVWNVRINIPVSDTDGTPDTIQNDVNVGDFKENAMMY